MAPTTSNTPEAAALSTVQTFLSGIKSKDRSSMFSCVLPDGHALLIRPSPSSSTPQHLRITLTEVIDRIPFDSPKIHEENIALAEFEKSDDGDLYGGRKTEVRVDGDLAMCWTPYVFLIEGELHHVGTNVWSLVKMRGEGEEGEGEGKWVIAWISDTLKAV